MNKIRLSLYTLSAMLLVTLGFNFISSANNDTQPAAFASWAFNPASMDQLKAKATDIVVGKVVKVDKGDDIILSPKGEPEAQHIPTQVVTFEVTEALKGDTIGQQITIFRTGGEDLTLEGDPAYTVGNEYLLFLRPQNGSNHYLVVAPAGRFEVANGRLQPVVEKGFGSQYKGLALNDFILEVKKAK